VGLSAGVDAELERPGNATGRVVDITPSGAARRRRDGQKLR